MNQPNKWEVRFMRLALLEVANWSKDPVKKVGCVIVHPSKRLWVAGYNGFPAHVDDRADWLCDTNKKNNLMIHAEKNAVDNAPCSVKGWTAFVTQPPCSDCANILVNAEVARVVRPPIDYKSKWSAGQATGNEWLLLNGIRINIMKSIVTGEML